MPASPSQSSSSTIIDYECISDNQSRPNLFDHNGNIISAPASSSPRGRSRAPSESFDAIDENMRQRLAMAEKSREDAAKDNRRRLAMRRMEELEEEARQLHGELPPSKPMTSLTLPAPQVQPLVAMGEFFDSHEGEGPIFTKHSRSLRQRFPAINTDHFRDIWRNTFRPINVVKLGNDFGSIVEPKKQLWNVVGGKLEKIESDSIPAEIRGLTHLLKYLIVYFQILLKFTPEGNQVVLQAAFADYQLRLINLTTIYTWESIRRYHLIFHSKRIMTGPGDAMGWRTVDRDLENEFLEYKPPPAKLASSSRKPS